ncbi:hypothetical protein CAEBREN_19714 [Caenorhabditis brenneri]|uniref:Uncharacterized protein n=1 Tax=Caenorhabditis brenneri TaxID=135651 RepID=G0NS43_CAEBE|nr:hypothetical protein CAEBREN_19714 [Caenorhabditis brenneri]
MKRQLTEREAAVYEEMNKRLQNICSENSKLEENQRLIDESEKKLQETLNQVKENMAKIEGALNPSQNDGQNDAENAQEDRLVEPRPKKRKIVREENGANPE